MPDLVFRARALTKTYDMGEQQIHALRGVDLDLHRGELVVLLGASGSGKSTLLNILGGLDTATSGEVQYGGHDLTRVSERELTEYRRHHVGFVFQFYNLIASLTARENVEVVTEIAADFAGDAFAPVLRSEWVETARDSQVSANGLPFHFVTYDRNQANKAD